LYRYLIFDLDETLYPRDAGLMQEIARLITRYMIERMGFAPEAARAKRKRYYQTYGTSLRGLLVEETVDADDYLRFVHDIDLSKFIGPNAALDAMLRRIPLTKVIFTNASHEHAQRVLSILGVAEHFSIVVDIRDTQFVNKPDTAAYQLMLAKIDARPEACILVEDNPRNLLPAKALGMKTILVDHAVCDEVDYCVKDLLDVEDVVRSLLKTRTTAQIG
jgi:putative hydrolase of the HAD superfamily